MITSEQAKQMCDRNFGIGGDGVSILSTVCFPKLFTSWMHLGHAPLGAPVYAVAGPCAGCKVKCASGSFSETSNA